MWRNEKSFEIRNVGFGVCHAEFVEALNHKIYKISTLLNLTYFVMLSKVKTQIDKIFPWVHTCISNAKRILLGVHHSIKSDYMQNYLDEFYYKFNRRYFGENLFERLLVVASTSVLV